MFNLCDRIQSKINEYFQMLPLLETFLRLICDYKKIRFQKQKNLVCWELNAEEAC